MGGNTHCDAFRRWVVPSMPVAVSIHSVQLVVVDRISFAILGGVTCR